MGERAMGPVLMRRRLGKQLRAIREKAAVSRVDAAAYIGLGGPTLSKIEHGKQNIGIGNLRSLLQLYGVDEETHAELLSEGIQANKKDWWIGYIDVIPEWFRIFIGIEADADQILTYEAELVPGLLQTEEYTSAVRRAWAPGAGDEDAHRYAQLRFDRQQHLVGDEPPVFHAIVNEAVLRRVVGSPEVMRGQLEHLLSRAELDHVRIQVLPFSAGAHPGMSGAFSILLFAEDELSTVYVDNEPGGLYHSRPVDLARYRLLFDQLIGLALDQRKSADFIAKLAKQM